LYDMSTNPENAAMAGATELITLRAGPNRVVIDPARGGRLASWTVDGEELLVGPPDDVDASIHWGCFLMAPWPGRLAGGRFEWRGRTIQLRRTHGRHAIHGLTWNRAWSVHAASADAATLSIELPRAEWPMGGRVRQRVAVTDSGVRLEAEIEADEPMPAALGWHPWFLRRGDPRLRVDAAAYQRTDGMIPTGETVPVSGRTDLGRGPRLGRRRLDLAYVDANSPAVITWPGLELQIEFEPSPSPLVVYTPPDSFCVEPLTAPPNALNGHAIRNDSRGSDAGTATEHAGPTDLAAGGFLSSSIELGWRSKGRASAPLSSRP
jgi:aldose 1-epimerase